MFDQAAVRQWLAILHGDAPGQIHICATGNWIGRTFATTAVDDAAAYAAQLHAEGREGVYARITTLVGNRDGERRVGRGGVDDTAALPALWGDIDIAGPGHKEDNLPPDEAEARAVVVAARLPEPTVWIHSGGGLYPIWLLAEPYSVSEDRRVRVEQLADLRDLSAHWQKALGAGAAKLGYHYGTGVGDLARVLRLPGTVNRKVGLERPCRVLHDADGAQYTLEDLHRWAVDALAVLDFKATADDTDTLRAPRGATAGVSPGDDYAARTSWHDILEPHGWTHAYRRALVDYWRRPGKETPGISATTNALGTDRLRVFTTATAFEVTSYSKLGAFAMLEHGGDLKAAGRALAAANFGTAPAEHRDNVAGVLGPGAQLPATPATAPTAGEVGPLDEDLLAEVRYYQEVAYEARRERIRRDARRRADAEEFAAQWTEPPYRRTLAEELELPDDDVAYRIARLLPTGGNAVLISQFKAGKTTVCNNLIRALADGEPFLGRFDVAMPEGRVAVWNYEVGDSRYRQWLRDIGITNTDRVSVLNVRGHAMPALHPPVRDWIIKWLKDHEVAVWIVDPFARAFIGSGEENSNSDVGVFLDALDVIKKRAGVAELVLPVHTGRADQEAGQERARGATRLDDWSDARWLLTTDTEGRRYFRAHGRDVDVPEEMLKHDPVTHRLTMGGWDRKGMQVRDLADEVIAYVADNPGLGVNEVVSGLGRNRNRTIAALGRAIADHKIAVFDSANRKRLHYPPGARPSMAEREL